jgi:hypothetical protein
MGLRSAALVTILLATAASLFPSKTPGDPRLNGSVRGARGGWITVRLEGSPAQVGYQHGYWLAREIQDAIALTRLNLMHDSKHDWAFYRSTAQEILWPRIELEYREELQGIAAGAAAQGVKADLWDIVVLNASIELPYYTATLGKAGKSNAPDRCSAFVATGSMTRDGKVVIGHNNWSGYLEGSRWNVMFDIRPERGQRMLMDGFPGMIHSADDFGINSAGIVITETTITGFKGFDPKGIPEFVRARKAMQYAKSIDDFDRMMRDGNNGGYANTWLVADINTNEIARLELGLKNVTLERTSDGYFVGANFPINPKLTAEETDFPAHDLSVSANARRTRWEEIMGEYKGKIDIEAGRGFLSDHYDAFAKAANSPSERTLCGHVDLSPRGLKPWAEAFGPNGTVQNKITDAALARVMTLDAANGHACGLRFHAAEFLQKHPEYNWQKALLRDVVPGPWTRFAAEPR